MLPSVRCTMSLTELLLATQVPDKNAQAEAQIKAVEQNNIEQYFIALAQELAGADKPTIARQLAGLLLKNSLAAKDATRNKELKARWAGLPAQSRQLVKQATTSSLTAQELQVGKAAAQVLAKIGTIEVPVGEWPDLVDLLLDHVKNIDPRARQISLITLGYLCEDLVALQEDGITIADEISNKILTAVVQGMRDGDMTTKLEAARAFYHAVVLAQRNFQDATERNFILTVVAELCRPPCVEEVQIAGFECLVQIATEYYDFLIPRYMNSLGPLTWDTIRAGNEKVAIPAMEFWSTICDEELYLADLVAAGQAGQRVPLNLIQQALPFLMPVLTETLTKQQCEEDDDDTWNLHMAAGACLTLVAQVVGDACVDLTLAFVEANFENPDWKCREAAILAYGSIMEGPTSEKMLPMVQRSYNHLVRSLNDPSVAVRDTIAWTLGRIAQFHPAIVPIKELTPVLGEKLNDVPRVSAHICFDLQVLAESMPGFGGIQAPDTTPLSEFFPQLAQALLQVVARPDAMERQLRLAGYNALSALVTHAGNDCAAHMARLVQEMLSHLQQSFKNIDKECELQSQICGVLTSLVQRLREQITPVAEAIMQECLKVITAYQQVRGGAAVLQEEALLLAMAVAGAVGPKFEMFMPHFAPHLRVGLQNYEDVTVCVMSTRAIGELCGALEGKIINYCDTILQILYTNLQTAAVDKKIKAVIMPCFGDIALAIQGEFEKYLPPVVNMLKEASQTRLDGQANNEEWIEYLNTLREGVLEAYTGIVHGLRDAGKLHLFKEHVMSVLYFVSQITEDTTASEAVMKAAVGVVGDLVFAFQQELAAVLGHEPFLAKLVTYASGCQDPKMRQTSAWLQKMLQAYSGR